MDRAQATPTVMVDNDRVRVTEWRFAPGAATGWHVHAFDYVITPVAGQPVDIVDGAGAVTRVEMVPGQSYYREAGVAHDVINAGAGELVFVETELKEPARG
ncbi:MAG: cupin domain-containing protein [Pseudomonadota bacterium]